MINPILYLHECACVPTEILLWKNDEMLEMSCDAVCLNLRTMPPVVCVGIGTYQCAADGELYLCALIDPESLFVVSWSVGVYCTAELVRRALERLYESFAEYPACILRSSRNALYRGEAFQRAIAPFPVTHETTVRGVRGGVFAVSTFFSQLMRNRGKQPFSTWQQGIDWLSRYVNVWNRNHSGTIV